MIKAGDKVIIKAEYQDEGDSDFTWIAVDDEEKGRVTISPIDINLIIKPTCVVQVSWLE